MTSRTVPHRAFLRASLAILLAGTALAACGEPFDPPSLIEKTRVLGARVEVEGDSTRATPRPGERATVTWIMAAPGELPPLGWAFVVCRSGFANPAEACAPAPLAMAQGTGTPSFEVTAPTADVLGATQRLQLLGQICEDSAPIVDAQTNLPTCPGAGTRVTLDVALQLGEAGNHNPALAERPFWFDGVDWSADAGADCASLPRVAAGSKGHVIRVATLAEDREAIVVPGADPSVAPTSTRETLQLSNFATAGELGQSFSVVEASDPRSEADLDVTWDAPDLSPVEGRVHFTFVARDLRGGVGLATRTVCVE